MFRNYFFEEVWHKLMQLVDKLKIYSEFCSAHMKLDFTKLNLTSHLRVFCLVHNKSKALEMGGRSFLRLTWIYSKVVKLGRRLWIVFGG